MRTHSLPTLLAGFVVALAAASAPAPLRAQDPGKAAVAPRPDSGGKKVLTVPDYGRWRVIEGEHISSDGRWVTWVYRYTNVMAKDSRPVLHILNVRTHAEDSVPGAYHAAFSPNGRWLAYEVDSVPGHETRGGRGAGADTSGAGGEGAGGRRGGGNGHSRTLHRMEIRELATGRTSSWHDMQSATFSETSGYALLRNRPVAGGRGGRRGGFGGFGRGGRGAEPPARGSDAILVDLATGRGRLLGSVGDAAFNRAGDLLAYTVDATERDANGLFVTDLATGATRALDNSARIYTRLAWNDRGTGVAVLRGEEVPKMVERDNVLLVVPNVRAAMADPATRTATLDTTATGFPAGWVISDRASLEWSEDATHVFFGAKTQLAAKDTVPVEGNDSTANVDVWRTADRYIQSVQMIRARQDRNFTYREAFDVAGGRYVALSDSTLKNLQISPDGRWAVGSDARPYISDWKPAAADFYRVSTATGERTPMLKDQLLQGARFGISPDGRTFVYWRDDTFHAYDLASGTSTTLGAGAPSFVDTTFDHPGPKPPWGVAGYTADGESVIVEGRYDLWTLPLDGARATNITSGFGAKNRVVLRPVRLAPIDSTVSRAVRTGRVFDLSGAVTLSAFGDLTKKAGFYRLSKGRLTEVVYDAAEYDTPDKAAHADAFLFTRQTFTEAPDLRVSGPDFGRATKITDSNPQQAEYRWGHDRLFDFTDRFGHELQGLLWLPDGYRPGDKLPMLVTFYEKNSQLLNHYPMPELLVSMGRPAIEAVSRGYIVMIPDIHYNTGSSHDDQLDCVEAATRKVVAMGYADPERIGLHGHSYAGEGAAYIATRSRLFAAVGEGAGVTDLYTDFSQEWGWSYQVQAGSGQNGSQYYEYDQGRWGFSPWDRPDVYHDESALTHVPEVTEPILIMHGTADPTVNFIESLNFYNALRFNGKTAFLLAYLNEGHHVSTIGNRQDLTTRFFQFFDHYLLGAPAPKWITDGVPFLEKAERTNPGPDKVWR